MGKLPIVECQFAIENWLLLGDRRCFALGAENAFDRVGGATLRFVVVAYLHFAQQSDGQHV